jgi:integrase
MADKLTALACKSKPDGRYSDGNGLYLLVKRDGASRAWVVIYTSPTSGRRREMGLGSLDEVGLAEARDRAGDARKMARNGVDPLDARDARRAEGAAVERAKRQEDKRQHLTLLRAARSYHEREIEPKRTRKHAKQWIASIETHVPQELLNRPLDDIQPPELLDALRAIYRKVPETGRRVRQRLDEIYDDAIFRKQARENPAAAIKRRLKSEEQKKGSFAALPYRDAPAFMKRLREQPGTSARALEFAMLTAGRTAEILGMKWSELSADRKTWTVPAERMKADEEHVVPLSPAARAVLTRVQGDSKVWVFKSPAADRALSNMAMLTTLKRMQVHEQTTVHGLCRSTFSTWANETGAARPDVIEACLAHQEEDRVRRAYNRAEFAAERRALLEAWARYLDKDKRRKA